jgi:hypothetical protein
MNPIPCPKCGRMLACGPEALGRTFHCPECGVRLTLDAGDGPEDFRARRRLRLRRLAFVVLVFLIGTAFGFVWGRGMAGGGAQNGGVSVNAFGLFSAHNHVEVNDAPPPPPEAPRPDGR